MSNYDRSPANWGSGEIGVLKFQGNSGEAEYQMTTTDAIVLAIMAKHEDYYPYLALWSIVQRFAGFRQNRKRREGGLNGSTPDGLMRYCQYFSAPINPTYAFQGRPSPSRAVGRCPNGTVGTGRIPNAHSTGVPVRPNTRIWNAIHCTSGRATSHGRDSESKKAERRERFVRIRRAMQGDDQAYLSETDSRSRLATWNFLHGQAGNPIPGFDNWAACWAYQEGGAVDRRIILPDLSVAEQEDALRRIRSMSHSQLREQSTYVPVRFGAAMGSARRQGFGQVSRSNCFLYHTFLNNGDRVWVEWDNGTRVYDSRRAEIDMTHTEGAGSAAIVTAADGGVVTATPEGLAPTRDRPSTTTTGSASSGSSSSRSTGRRSELGSEEEMFNDLEDWANRMEAELTREFGVGRVRR